MYHFEHWTTWSSLVVWVYGYPGVLQTAWSKPIPVHGWSNIDGSDRWWLMVESIHGGASPQSTSRSPRKKVRAMLRIRPCKKATTVLIPQPVLNSELIWMLARWGPMTILSNNSLDSEWVPGATAFFAFTNLSHSFMKSNPWAGRRTGGAGQGWRKSRTGEWLSMEFGDVPCAIG